VTIEPSSKCHRTGRLWIRRRTHRSMQDTIIAAIDRALRQPLGAVTGQPEHWPRGWSMAARVPIWALGHVSVTFEDCARGR
jgi:hypothetical protein